MIKTNTFSQNFEVPEGTATSSVYVVNYDEDLWYSLPIETKDYCYQRWTELAEPHDVDEVVLILMPDPVFPSHGKERPYVHWRHMFPKNNGGEWIISIEVSINTNDNRYVLGDALDRFTSYFGDYPKGTKFKLHNLQNKLLWEHTT